MLTRLWRFFVVWTNWQTLLAASWRFCVAVADWRTILRRAKNQPIVDAVFVTNMRDRTDRQRYLGLWRPKDGHFNGPRYWINGVVGRTRALDITTEDLTASEGRKKAKKYFINATQWAKDNGAKVILLAASTKRLFGEDGTQLKKLFPNLIFTIGDNGTFFLLREETLRALKNANLKPRYCRIGILGPYGFLGEMMVQALTEKGYDIIGAGPNISALERINKKYRIDTCRTFDEMGKVDAIIACTHSEKIRLNAENIELIRRPDKKLLVVDVAEPSNLKYREFQKRKGVVIRQDAGNAYSPDLKYVLGAVSYKMFRLTQGVTFGCFAEALSLAATIKQGGEVEA
jgi:predicted amino acid dehydrogenase